MPLRPGLNPAQAKLLEKVLPSYFPFISNAEFPDIIAQSWGVETADLTLVGDSLYDAQTAANAGCHCILVTWGYANIQEIHNWGAPTCGTVEELRRLTLDSLLA